MKRYVLLIAAMLTGLVSMAQSVVTRSNGVNTVKDERLIVGKNFIPPRFNDTTAANLVIGLDSCGAVITTRFPDVAWQRICDPVKKWQQLGSGSAIEVSDSAWMLLGNAVAPGQFMGSTNNEDVIFKRNSIEAARLIHRQVEVKNIYLGGIVTDYDDTTAIIYKYHPGLATKTPFIYNYRKSGTDGENLFMGLLAGNQSMSGTGIQASYNTGFGPYVFHNNTTGFRNAAFGSYPLGNNTTGFSNNAFGHSVLGVNTTGYNNSGFGTRTLLFNTTGHSNNGFGTDALFANTVGIFNSAFSIDALYQNTTGSYNSAFGDSTFWIGTVGIKNSAFGSRAGYYLGDTYPNFGTVKDSMVTFLGADASRDSSVSNTIALINSTAIGYNAKVYASNQVSIGNNSVTSLLLRGAMNNRNYGSGANTGTAAYNLQVTASGDIIEGGIPLTAWNTTGNGGTTPGTNFLGTTDNVSLMFKANNVQAGLIDLPLSSTSFGYESLLSNTSAAGNTAFGFQALKTNVNGPYNTAMGYQALYSANGSTAGYNTAVGESALFSSTTGRRNVAIGRRAGVNITTGQINTIVGAYDVSGDQALTTGGSNTSVGYNTFKFHNGDQNTAVGVAALSGFSGVQTSSQNTGIGYDALFNVQTGDGNNTATGFRSGYSTTTGSFNAFFGDKAGYYNTTGSNQVFLNTLDRSNFAGDTSASPFYAMQDATVTSQRVRLNGRVFMEHIREEVTDTTLYYNPTTDEITYGLKPAGGGSGETNTASNLGGGLDNFDSKSGVDLRFNTFAAADFDLASNLITIDATKWLTIAAGNAAYQPLDADLTYLAGFTPTANVKSILNAADYSAVRTLLSLVPGTNVQVWDADLDYLATFTPTANVKSILNAADYAAIKTLLSLTVGTNVQAWDADLDYLATFTPTANVKSILNAADYAAVKALLDLEIGTDVQAWDADLDYLSTFTPAANVKSILNAADYSAIRTLLGLVIGTNVQAYDADLTTYAGITPSANVQSLLGAADYSAMRTQLGLVIGTNVQAYDADLTTYAGITPSANVQSFLGAADYSAMRTQLGLVIGTNVQAYDADLTTWAGISPSANIQSFAAAANYAAARVLLLPSLTGNSLKGLRVNAGETDVEWATISGGSGATTALDNLSAVAINAALVLGTSDAFALGSASKQWSDLFLAEGGVIDWDNGDATLTQVGNVVTLAGADLKITSPGTASTSVATIDGTQTLTNKRIQARTGTTASSGTPTINTDNVDRYFITALAANITSFTTNLSGTPVTGEKLWISIKDNGTPRTITWGASFSGSLLPATTVAGVVLNVWLEWDGSTWYNVATQ